LLRRNVEPFNEDSVMGMEICKPCGR